MEKIFQNYFERIIWKSFFKGGKTVFSKNDGVQEEICRGAERRCLCVSMYYLINKRKTKK